MTDKQTEKLYSNIKDFDEFMDKITSKQDVLSDNFIIRFLNDQTIEIRIDGEVEKITVDNFETIITELRAQWTSDRNFDEIKKNRISDREINIRDDRTFIITDRFLMNLTFGKQISSGFGWYVDQIKQIYRLLDSGYTLIHNDRVIHGKAEFIEKYMNPDDIKSLENKLG